MHHRVLIIGKNSFIGKNFFNRCKVKRPTKIISFKNFLKIKKKKLNKFDIIINFSISDKYVNNKYRSANDIDCRIAQKIKDIDILYIFLSTRKVYKNNENIRENSYKKPSDNYSINKFISENKLKTLLNNNLLVLRISNVIGIKKRSLSRIHKTFIDYYFENIKKGKIIKFNKEFKDFLGIEQLTIILDKIVEKKLSGIYNVSLGKKVYIKEIISWLNTYNNSHIKYVNLNKKQNKDNFTLNNKKLVNAINMKIYKKDLKKECILISKTYFKNKS
tara:strand:- start:2949 stop:3773 length:825 start_codon:yes stop_codon:yes gene_type:complete